MVFKKILAIIVILIAFINILLFSFLVITATLFLSILAVCAIITYTVFPRKKKKL